MNEEEKRKLMEFEDGLYDLMSKTLDGVSLEAIREYFGYDSMYDIIKGEFEHRNRLLKILKIKSRNKEGKE